MPQQLPSKEASTFRSVVKYYEGKQYKKGLKAADQILKKFPNHGDTQSMKALILNSQGHTEEAFELGRLALKNDMKSHVCWHVYGLLHRSQKGYGEAIKAYKMALRIEPDSPNILRDLALLQAQTRDYAGYIQSRKTMVQARPSVRQNWTALAVAQHLAGDYKSAENTLVTYEKTLKNPPPKTDLEHSEATLYKNTIIAESGDVERALEDLEKCIKYNLDRTAVMEMKAKYLLDLGRKEEAEKAYEALLERNNEYRAYYDGLEKARGLDRSDEASLEGLKALYEFYAGKSERVDAARRIPLDFLKGDDFKAAADRYLRRMLNKGVPSTFANIKALYADPSKKQVIEELVLGYDSAKKSNGEPNGEVETETSDRFEQSVIYFLAQHYNYHLSRDLNKAMEYIDRAIELSPKSVDYHQTKARIWKHYGNTQKASETIEKARQLDEKDRYINTKCAKYQLRNNENETALKTMSKFTRNETVGGPLGDLHDMQCVWYLLEDGEAYLRQRDLGLALKRFTAVSDIFDIWQDDQFDFHSFSLRKGQIRAYVDMIRWEDHLRDHPFFTRAALSAIKIYLQLADKPELGNPDNGKQYEGMDATERKKAQRKAKKEQEQREKEEAERKAAAAKKPATKEDGETKKEDPDPKGIKLLETKDPLTAALKFLTPMLEFSPKTIEGQNLGFEVHFRRNKHLLALNCLLAARALDPENPTVHEQAVRFRQALDAAKDIPHQVAETFLSEFPLVPAGADLPTYNREWQKKHADSASRMQAALKVQYLLDPKCQQENEKQLLTLLELPSITKEEAFDGLACLDAWGSEQAVKDEYRGKAAERWPEVTVFQKN